MEISNDTTCLDCYLESFEKGLSSRNYKPATLNNYRCLLRRFGRLLDTEGIAPSALTPDLTGAEHRLNRQHGKRFGDVAYAFEELVAEIASGFLCAELGISSSLREDHVQYIANWLEILKGDKKAIFAAASQASHASNFLVSLQPDAQAADDRADDPRDDAGEFVTIPQQPTIGSCDQIRIASP